MKHQLLLIAVLVAVLYFASRKSPGTPYYVADSEIVPSSPPLWDYNA